MTTLIINETHSSQLLPGNKLTVVGTCLVYTNVDGTLSSVAQTGTAIYRYLTPVYYKITALGDVTITEAADTANPNDVSLDLTPKLGGDLDVNGKSLGDGTLELLKFVETSNAVNELTVTNAATGNGPILSATGANTNIDLNLNAKGSGSINLADQVLSRPELLDFSLTTAAPASASNATELDVAAGNAFDLQLTETTTISIVNPSADGKMCTLKITLEQTGAANFVVSWPAAVLWVGGSAPTITTGSGAIDVVTLITNDAGTTWYGSYLQAYA